MQTFPNMHFGTTEYLRLMHLINLLNTEHTGKNILLIKHLFLSFQQYAKKNYLKKQLLLSCMQIYELRKN